MERDTRLLEREFTDIADSLNISPEKQRLVFTLLRPLRSDDKSVRDSHYNHSLRVGIETYNKMKNIAHYLASLFLAATLHDVGKTLMSETLLMHDCDWNDECKNMMRVHAEAGYHILYEHEMFFEAAVALLHHNFQPHSYEMKIPKEHLSTMPLEPSAFDTYAKIVADIDSADAKQRGDRNVSSYTRTPQPTLL